MVSPEVWAALFGPRPTAEPFEMTENDRKEMAAFENVLVLIQQQKLSRLRELARQKGVVALNLENLKSECGAPFVEESGYPTYRRAIARGKPFHYEFAYLCASQYDNVDQNTCGWVKGRPTESPYNKLGPLCGSAGVRHHCRICGKLLAEEDTVHS